MNLKKLFIFIAVIGLIPLLLVFSFFIYRIKLNKENTQKMLSSGAKKESISLDLIQSSRSALQKLAEHSLLKEYLESISHISAEGKNLEQSKEQQELYGFIEEFQSRNPDFKQIIVKSALSGIVYLNVPAGITGKDLPDIHLVVTIPVLDNKTTTPQAALQGVVTIDLHTIPSKINDRGSPLVAKKKFAMVFVWLFALLLIIIPFIMFMVYRQMNKMLDAQLPGKPPPTCLPWEVDDSQDSQGKGQNE